MEFKCWKWRELKESTIHDLVLLVELFLNYFASADLNKWNWLSKRKWLSSLKHGGKKHWKNRIFQHEWIVRCVVWAVDVFQGGDQSGAQVRSPRNLPCGGSVQQRRLQHYSLQKNCHPAAWGSRVCALVLRQEPLSQGQQLQSSARWPAPHSDGSKRRQVPGWQQLHIIHLQLSLPFESRCFCIVATMCYF